MPAIMSNTVPLFFAPDARGSFSRTAIACPGAAPRLQGLEAACWR